MRAAIELGTLLYRAGPAKGRRSLWVSIRLGRRTWWLNRHPEAQLAGKPHTKRLPEPRSPMCWRIGAFTTTSPEGS